MADTGEADGDGGPFATHTADGNRATMFFDVDRGVSFEDVVLAIESGGLLDAVDHPNPRRYPSQGVYVVAIASYVYLVPHVDEPDYVFLKTIIPSRKATRDYRRRVNDERS